MAGEILNPEPYFKRINCSIYWYIYTLFSNRILFSHDRFYPETVGSPKLSIKCLRSLDSEIICHWYCGVFQRDSGRKKNPFFHSFLAGTAMCRRKKGRLLIKHKNCIRLLYTGQSVDKHVIVPATNMKEVWQDTRNREVSDSSPHPDPLPRVNVCIKLCVATMAQPQESVSAAVNECNFSASVTCYGSNTSTGTPLSSSTQLSVWKQPHWSVITQIVIMYTRSKTPTTFTHSAHIIKSQFL
jgi:hypothetical protein